MWKRLRDEVLWRLSPPRCGLYFQLVPDGCRREAAEWCRTMLPPGRFWASEGIFFGSVLFKHEADLVMFRLAFSEPLKGFPARLTPPGEVVEHILYSRPAGLVYLAFFILGTFALQAAGLID